MVVLGLKLKLKFEWNQISNEKERKEIESCGNPRREFVIKYMHQEPKESILCEEFHFQD